MIEEKVDVKIFFLNLKVVLAAKKSKSYTKLQQELSDMFYQSFL